MNPAFHPGASDELADAIAYYECCDPGLGIRFQGQVEAAVARISSAPDRWPKIAPKVRRYVLPPRFPYVIFYTWAEDQITIMAVSHASREPGYWRHRLG